MSPSKGISDTTGVTLSPTEQRVHLVALRRRVITAHEAIEVYGRERLVRKALVGLTHKGYLLRVTRGLYGAVPPEFAGRNYEIDRYLVAQKAARHGGAVGYHSALELHGVANSSVNTVYYLTSDRLSALTFQEVDYRFVTTRVAFGTTQLIRQGVPVTVTDRERTFLDCIRRPELAGGLEEMLKSLGTFPTMDTTLLRDYLSRFGEQSLDQRAGLVLSLLKAELRIPEEFLARMRRSVGGKAYYLIPGMRKGTGRLEREWNVIVPRNVDEVMRGV
jgi:predicted transcriptional regulator of viral defense system